MKPPPAIINVLSGAWNLINQTTMNQNGTIKPGGSFAPPSYGIIIYHPVLYMSANIQTIKPAEGTNTNVSYAGPFSWEYGNETSGLLIHGPLAFSTKTEWYHTPQKRHYTLFDGGKVLRLTAFNESTSETGVLFWQKVESDLADADL